MFHYEFIFHDVAWHCGLTIQVYKQTFVRIHFRVKTKKHFFITSSDNQRLTYVHHCVQARMCQIRCRIIF